MTDIEQRARDALNLVTGERDLIGGWERYGREEHTSIEALCREIEAHDATKAELADFKREVSEAVKLHIAEAWRCCSALWAGVTRDALSRFIQPDPVEVDPLVEAMLGAWPQYADRLEACRSDANALRKAVEASGGKIVWEGDAK